MAHVSAEGCQQNDPSPNTPEIEMALKAQSQLWLSIIQPMPPHRAWGATAQGATAQGVTALDHFDPNFWFRLHF